VRCRKIGTPFVLGRMYPNNEEQVARMLREQRPELTPVEKDRLKLRAMRAAHSRSRRAPVKSRLIVIATVAAMAAGTGGAIALTGGHAGNAAVAQYGSNGENGQNGANGANGFNGNNGANGQNGAPGTSTVITINIPAAAPLPGTAKPTKKNHTRIRVCKRYPHRSAKFHGHVFHPKVCWIRFV
jgi:hypothetical protein